MTKKNSSIIFSKNNNIGTLSKHMVGTNLEHIGNAIYGKGIWSEVIKNRKFCGTDKVVWSNG